VTHRTSAWVRDGQHRRILRSPGGYLLFASCRGRLWVGWTPDPEQTEELIRTWSPFPVHHVERKTMPRDKVDQLLAAISPWRVRRGSSWHRTPPEMKDALDRVAATA
jgi:hypothetical protein